MAYPQQGMPDLHQRIDQQTQNETHGLYLLDLSILVDVGRANKTQE